MDDLACLKNHNFLIYQSLPGVHVERKTVSSSNLRSVGYAPTTETLEIEFHKSGVYQYLNVPVSIYNRLMSAHSKGEFFDGNIKERYRYKKIS